MNNSKIISLLDKSFGKGVFSRDKENYQIVCPECKKSKNTTKKKLHVKVDDLRYHCWVCGIKGKNIITLVNKHRPDLVDKSLLKKSRTSQSIEKQESPPLSLPEGLVPIFKDTNDPDVKAVKKYLAMRGVSNQKIRRWRILTSKTGELRRHAVIPSFDEEGNLNYYVGRSIDETNFRYRNAKKKKTDIIFNEIDIDWTKTVTLVEGVFDAIKCPENTIPILGSNMPKSSLLYRQLSKFQPDVIVSLDPDMPEKTYILADQLSLAGCTVYVTFAPYGRDLGDMSYEKVKNLLSSKIEYNPYMKIKHKIGALRSGSVF